MRFLLYGFNDVHMDLCIYICVYIYGFVYGLICILRVWFLMFFGWELPRCLEDSESYHKGPGD